MLKLNGMISILVICLAGHRKDVQLRKRCRNTNTDLHTDLRGSFVVPENIDHRCNENCCQSKNLNHKFFENIFSGLIIRIPRDSHKHIQAIRLLRHLDLGCHLLGFPTTDSNRK